MPSSQAAPSLSNGAPRRAGFVALAPIAIALIVPLTPKLSAAQPSHQARLVPRDWPAWLAQPGLAFGPQAGSPAPRVLRWAWAEAGSQPDGSLAACVHRRGNPSACKAGMPTHGRLRYEGVSPGVALTVGNRPHAVAYRFDVAPYGEARKIRMRYSGADRIAVEDGGRALLMQAGGRALRESGLFCYQRISGERREVPCRYRIAVGADGTHEVAFDIGAYDRSRRLVVDPSIAWSSYLGGGGDDSSNAIAVDASGDVYVVGWTASANFPTAGGFDTSYGGFQDAFVAKVDPGAGLLWSSYLGGSNEDEGNAVAVDGSGNVYVVGRTFSSDFPSTDGFDTSLGGALDAFVTKVDAAGSSLLWSSYLGGDDDDQGNGIAIDGSGNVYVVGDTASSDFPSAGGFDTSLGGIVDAFVAEVDPTGSGLAWSSYLGGASDDYGTSVAVDASGDVYLVGVTSSVDFPSAGGFDASFEGSADAFVAKVDPVGASLVWSSYLGGDRFDEGYAVAVDASGNAYVTGYTTSTDFPTAGGFDAIVDAAGDAFVTKVDATGSSLAWSSYLGGSNYDEGGYGVAVDSGGNAYVTGGTFSSDFPTLDGFDTSLDLSGEAFVTMVDAAGSSLTWSSYLGGDDSEAGNGVVVDDNDNVYVTGYTFSSDFPSVGGFDTSLGGTLDAFVTQIFGTCGNANCDVGENPCNCPEDCGADTCGNGCCGPTESKCDCPADCTDDICGDGCCTGVEDCASCSTDCGFCPEPAPDMMPDAEPDGDVPDGDVPDSDMPGTDSGGQVTDGSQQDGGSDSDGCGCAVGQAPRERAQSFFALLLLLGAVSRRLRAR